MTWVTLAAGLWILRSAGGSLADLDRVPYEYQWIAWAWGGGGLLLTVCGIWHLATDRFGLRLACLLGCIGAITAGYLRGTGSVAMMQCTPFT